ncbi:hypothetical protein BV22DRAFT_416762 [Leucogyrophana mollusca]|uniref:Uncharacterized protein n=1 Tax=Leucogyrophana mollusca TaxID=85980 RepID=A0ACB8BKA8_9AGAM|nr:hypothetical protein BV22DRAFT_416762 [Leucogyrophana mollusca]
MTSLPDAKYWDKECERVVIGAPVLRSRAVPLEEICGTYKCFWDGDPEGGGTDVGEGSMTLSVNAEHKSGSKVLPADVTGHVKLGCLTFTLGSLVPASTNQWDVVDLDCVKDVDDGGSEIESCNITVLDVNDDSGVPFLDFTCHWEDTDCCSPATVSYIWRRQRLGGDGFEALLTETEQERLGMHLEEDEAEVVWKKQAKKEKKRAKKAKDTENAATNAVGSKRKAEEDAEDREPKLSEPKP